MSRSISDILESSDLSGMLLVTGEASWTGMWFPLEGKRASIAEARNANLGDALARATQANR